MYMCNTYPALEIYKYLSFEMERKDIQPLSHYLGWNFNVQTSEFHNLDTTNKRKKIDSIEDLNIQG